MKGQLMSYENKQLICNDCGKEFTFTAEEQEFFAQKGFSEPKRCPECRALKKAQRNEFQHKRFHRQEHKVICSECGCETTVPFEPRLDKPVYCQECYKKLHQLVTTANS